MIAEILLILATFAATVVGTYWNTTSVGKKTLVAIGFVATFSAIFLAISNNEEKNYTKGVLSALVQSVKPPAVFNEAILRSMRAAAKAKGYWVSGQSIREDGLRIFSLKPIGQNSSQPTGCLPLMPDSMQQLFLDFVSRKKLEKRILSELNQTGIQSDGRANWQRVLNDAAIMVRDAMGDKLGWSSPSTQFVLQFRWKDPQVRVTAINRVTGQRAVVVLNQKQLSPLAPLSRAERCRRVYDMAADQVSKN